MSSSLKVTFTRHVMSHQHASDFAFALQAQPRNRKKECGSVHLAETQTTRSGPDGPCHPQRWLDMPIDDVCRGDRWHIQGSCWISSSSSSSCFALLCYLLFVLLLLLLFLPAYSSRNQRVTVACMSLLLGHHRIMEAAEAALVMMVL